MNSDGPKTLSIDFVLQVAPANESASFIEIECDGKSISIGKWIKRPDGLWAIRITKEDIERVERETR